MPFGLGQPRGQDPHQLRNRLRADLGPGVRQVVLLGRVREAQAVGGCRLGPRDQDRRDDDDLTVRRTRDWKIVGGGAIPFWGRAAPGVDLLKAEFSCLLPGLGQPLIAAVEARDAGSHGSELSGTVRHLTRHPVARDHRWPVILLPGGILPAEPTYPAPLGELGDTVDARPKDLEIYAGPTVPPPGYSLETEVEGVRRVADDAGFETFHLVGYSAGGASAPPFASRDPGRLRSRALMEPAWAGRTGQGPEEAAIFDRFRASPEMAPEEIMPFFMRTQLADGVEPPTPPTGPPPPWMPSRLAALGTSMAAFDPFESDFDLLRRFDGR